MDGIKNEQVMRRFGLIGSSLQHSFSAKYFTEKFVSESITHCTYENFELHSINDLHSLLLSNPELLGLNVTIPYKEVVIPLLTEVDDEARDIGAVNTIVIDHKDSLALKGYNTDAHGFKTSITPLLSSDHTAAIILGTGGAAKTVGYVLKSMNIPIVYVSRSPKMARVENEEVISYAELSPSRLSTSPIIINTTPHGMHPNTDAIPDLPYHCLSKNHLLYDLIYNPKETEFLKQGKKYGAQTKNGQEMLVLQAEMSWKIWNS